MTNLTEVLQYDGDVHVDDDQKCNDEVGDKIEDGHAAVAAVAVRFDFGGRIIALGWIDHETR